MAAKTISDPCTKYARDVAEGRIVAGPLVRGACARHLRDLERDDIYFDTAAADKLYRFYELLLKVEGEIEVDGQLTKQELPFVLLPWQRFVLGSIIGWKWASGKYKGLRRFNEVFLTTGKGSGKTPMAAGMAIWMACADGELRPRLYVGAGGYKQAATAFNDVRNMIEMCPRIDSMFEIKGGAGTKANYIYCDEFDANIERIAFESQHSGFRPSFVLLDEVHEHKDGSMYYDMVSGLKSRLQGMVFSITNTGEDYSGLFGDLYNRTEQAVKEGSSDDGFFGYVCCLDEGERENCFDNEDCWIKTNPSLGTIVPMKYYHAQVKMAQTQDGAWSDVMRKNFCVPMKSENPLVREDVWDALLVDELPEVSHLPMVLGIDLSLAAAGTALACLWYDEDSDMFYVRSLNYLPEDKVLKRQHKERFAYTKHQASGELLTIPGPTVDLRYIAAKVVDLASENNIVAFGHDTFMKEAFHFKLREAGFEFWSKTEGEESYDHPEFILHGMGGAKAKGRLWMTESYAEFADRTVLGKMAVERNTVTNFHVLNASLFIKEHGNVVVERGVHNERTIDAAIAILVAVGLAKAKLMGYNKEPIPEGAFAEGWRPE